MTDVEALKLALSKERDAAARYRELSVKHSNLKDLFYSLMNEEEKHMRMIEQRIAQATR